jgi:hypothetical protein
MKQKIVLSSNHEHGWASEYPREYQEWFLMHPRVISLVENKDWPALVGLVETYWANIRYNDVRYANYPVCTDAIPDLKIHEVDLGAKFILNEVPYEHIVLINDHNVIVARV